jgi:hypothetical protein
MPICRALIVSSNREPQIKIGRIKTTIWTSNAMAFARATIALASATRVALKRSAKSDRAAGHKEVLVTHLRLPLAQKSAALQPPETTNNLLKQRQREH